MRVLWGFCVACLSLVMVMADAATARTLAADAPAQVREALYKAHAGDVESMHRVATYLIRQSMQGDEETASLAFGWALLAARNGHAEAAELTGVMYRAGTGVPQNFVKSRKWLERALARGSREANFELAVLYASEDNPGMTKTKSSKFLGEAIRGSEPRACLIAARNKINQGVELRRTLNEIKCAADGGLPEAMEMIAEYHLSKRSPHAKSTARKWLMQAIEAGSNTAVTKLTALEST
jgi:TPR repeat protein